MQKKRSMNLETTNGNYLKLCKGIKKTTNN